MMIMVLVVELVVLVVVVIAVVAVASTVSAGASSACVLECGRGAAAQSIPYKDFQRGDASSSSSSSSSITTITTVSFRHDGDHVFTCCQVMEAYGSDKPDTRYPLIISDITHHAKTRRLDLLYNSSPEAEVFNSAERVQVTFTRLASRVSSHL